MGETTEWRTIRVPGPVREQLADEKGDETWGELFTRLLASANGPDKSPRLETGLQRRLETIDERLEKLPGRVGDEVEGRLR